MSGPAPFTYGELFAGVSGMGLGLDAAGMVGRWRVELDRAAAGVIARHHPEAMLEADVVAFAKWISRIRKTDAKRFSAYVVRLIAGGSPCQDLSVAGARAGLAGERSGLFRVMVRICRILRPSLVLWENVAGALSSNGGRDFAAVIGAFTGCVPDVPDDGWGTGGFARAAEPGRWNVAWRVLDSQFFGVPQRRRRVFLVASLGDGSCVEILFEPESVRGDTAPSREARERVAGTLASRTSGGGDLGSDMEMDGGLQVAEIAPTLNAHFGDKQGLQNQHIDAGGDCSSPAVARPLTTSNQRIDAETETLIPTRRGGFFDDAPTHTLTGNGFDASEDGTGRGTPLVTAFDPTQITSSENRSNPQPDGPCHTLAKGAHAPAVAINLRGREGGAMAEVASVRAASGGSTRSYVAFSSKDSGADAGEVAPTLRAGGHMDSHQNGGVMPAVAITPELADPLSANEGKTYSHGGNNPGKLHNVVAGVRRLTPRECERLQGWPDDHTRWKVALRREGNNWRVVEGPRIEQADGPRYKQCGNGVTANVAEWIARRIVKFSR